jgi:hypothetical protein
VSRVLPVRGRHHNLGTPSIDGVVDETCWVNWTAIALPLGCYSQWVPEPPPFNILNGCLAVANDNEYLYVGLQLFNLTTSVALHLFLDDNATYGGYRGSVFYRTDSGPRIGAGQLRRYLTTEYWSYDFNVSLYQNRSADAALARWVWTTAGASAIPNLKYTMEGAFRFRVTSWDPDWLPERVPVFHLHLFLEVAGFYDNNDTRFIGEYAFPPGSYVDYEPFGLFSEQGMTAWCPIRCGYNLPFTSTTPPWLPWTLGLFLAATVASGAALGVWIARRGSKGE